MNDEEFEGKMDELIREYNKPPEAPRDAMWARIEAGLAERADEDADVIPLHPGQIREAAASHERFAWGWRQWGGLAVAAAALLVMGVGLGRLSVSPGREGPGVGAASARVSGSGSAAYRAVAAAYLADTESFLNLLKADARAGRSGPDLGGWAEGLLLDTRILMDSPASDDPQLQRLLEDLEFILVQVAVLRPERSQDSPSREGAELSIIAEGMDEQAVMERLHAAIPAVPGLVGA